MVKCYYRVDGEERNQAGLGVGGTDLSSNFVSTADSAMVLLGDILETHFSPHYHCAPEHCGLAEGSPSTSDNDDRAQ